MTREVSVPVTTLLAIVAGSECDLDAVIARLVGREVTEAEIDEYLSDHLSSGERAYARDVVNGWRRVHCNIPTRYGYEYRATLVDPQTRGLRSVLVVASACQEARLKAASYLDVAASDSNLYVCLAHEEVFVSDHVQNQAGAGTVAA